MSGGRVLAPAELFDSAAPPSQYSTWWLVLAIVLLGLAVLWIVVILLVSRIRPNVREGGPPSPKRVRGSTLEAARRSGLAEVDQVESEVGAHTLSVRDGHVRLSAILRGFARSARGVDAHAMTLSELRAAGLDPVADVVASYYPIAFDVDERSGLGGAGDRAREVLRSWP